MNLFGSKVLVQVNESNVSPFLDTALGELTNMYKEDTFIPHSKLLHLQYDYDFLKKNRIIESFTGIKNPSTTYFDFYYNNNNDFLYIEVFKSKAKAIW